MKLNFFTKGLTLIVVTTLCVSGCTQGTGNEASKNSSEKVSTEETSTQITASAEDIEEYQERLAEYYVQFDSNFDHSDCTGNHYIFPSSQNSEDDKTYICFYHFLEDIGEAVKQSYKISLDGFYYADTGLLSEEDPYSFSGKIRFTSKTDNFLVSFVGNYDPNENIGGLSTIAIIVNEETDYFILFGEPSTETSAEGIYFDARSAIVLSAQNWRIIQDLFPQLPNMTEQDLREYLLEIKEPGISVCT